MASTRPRLKWLVAVVLGVAVGVCGYLVAPAPIGANAGGTPGTGGAATPGSGPTTTAAPTVAPPFTRAALLQPQEFRSYGWGKADRTGIYDGAGQHLPVLCTSPRIVGAGAVEAYSAEYQGLQTHAVEIVVRHPGAAESSALFDKLAAKTGRCAAAGRTLRSTPTTRHEPKLTGIDEARWWQVEVPSGSGGLTRAGFGVVAEARIHDRLVFLVLTSVTTDPATTVQFEPLLTQAARRLV